VFGQHPVGGAHDVGSDPGSWESSARESPMDDDKVGKDVSNQPISKQAALTRRSSVGDAPARLVSEIALNFGAMSIRSYSSGRSMSDASCRTPNDRSNASSLQGRHDRLTRQSAAKFVPSSDESSFLR
jgi:hypothetical protein